MESVQTFFITAGAVVLDSANRVLLKQDPRRGWELPGGHLSAGESLEECVVREVREETGIDVRVVRLCGITYEILHRRCNTFWLARPTGGRLTTGAESRDVGYFDATKAFVLIQSNDFRQELARCLSVEDQPFSLTRP